MSILLTGGSGQTSLAIASILHARSIAFLATYHSDRVSVPHDTVYFDWLDSKTYTSVFSDPKHPSIKAVYLIAPGLSNPLAPMKEFIDLAVTKGVKRFVLLSASIVESGGIAMGTVHKYLEELGQDYCVLRPSWFMENFLGRGTTSSVLTEDKIYSAAQHGLIPFVAVKDIAAVAFHALTDAKSHNTDHFILGPKLHTYDSVATELSSVVGRRIIHVSLSEEDYAKRYSSLKYGRFMAAMDGKIAKGAEERMNTLVEDITGNKPVELRVFFEQHKKTWMK